MNTIVESEPPFVMCNRGHAMPYCLAICEICEVLNRLLKSDKGTRCAYREYMVGQSSFEFVCSYGHRFIASGRTCNKGCRTCTTLAIASKKHHSELRADCVALLAHNTSRIRVHCDKIRHNPSCESPKCVTLRDRRATSDYEFDPMCCNFAPCDQDFYATPKQLIYGNSILACRDNHRWTDRCEVYITVRLFEVQFDCQFDDDIRSTGLEFTGYNRALNLAFTHCKDRLPGNCIAGAIEWCGVNAVDLVVIPETIVKASSIAVEIARQLYNLNMLDVSAQAAVTILRTKLHAMDANNKLLDTRF